MNDYAFRRPPANPKVALGVDSKGIDITQPMKTLATLNKLNKKPEDLELDTGVSLLKAMENFKK